MQTKDKTLGKASEINEMELFLFSIQKKLSNQDAFGNSVGENLFSESHPMLLIWKISPLIVLISVV